MRVFLSWSGEPSRKAAEILREWLPLVIQAVEPWMSAKDIDKGARWAEEIGGELEHSDFGILVLTPENVAAPWILFEAGALSKKLGKGYVSPFLLGLKPTDLQGPLVQFQATESTAVETLRLVESVNRAMGTSALSDSVLGKAFEKWWPDLERDLAKIDTVPAVPTPRRTDRELLEETLSIARELARHQGQAVLFAFNSADSPEVQKLLSSLCIAAPDPNIHFSSSNLKRLRLQRARNIISHIDVSEPTPSERKESDPDADPEGAA